MEEEVHPSKLQKLAWKNWQLQHPKMTILMQRATSTIPNRNYSRHYSTRKVIIHFWQLNTACWIFYDISKLKMRFCTSFRASNVSYERELRFDFSSRKFNVVFGLLKELWDWSDTKRENEIFDIGRQFKIFAQVVWEELINYDQCIPLFFAMDFT